MTDLKIDFTFRFTRFFLIFTFISSAEFHLIAVDINQKKDGRENLDPDMSAKVDHASTAKTTKVLKKVQSVTV